MKNNNNVKRGLSIAIVGMMFFVMCIGILPVQGTENINSPHSTRADSNYKLPKIGLIETWESVQYNLKPPSAKGLKDDLQVIQKQTWWHPEMVFANDNWNEFDILIATDNDARGAKDGTHTDLENKTYDAITEHDVRAIISAKIFQFYQNGTARYSRVHATNNKVLLLIGDTGDDYKLYDYRTFGDSIEYVWNSTLVNEMGIYTNVISLPNQAWWNGSNRYYFTSYINASKSDVLLWVRDNGTDYPIVIITADRKVIFYTGEIVPSYSQYCQYLANWNNDLVTNEEPLMHYDWLGYNKALILTGDGHPSYDKDCKWFYNNRIPFSPFMHDISTVNVTEFQNNFIYIGMDINIHTADTDNWGANMDNYTWVENDMMTTLNLLESYGYVKEGYVFRPSGYGMGVSWEVVSNQTKYFATSQMNSQDENSMQIPNYRSQWIGDTMMSEFDLTLENDDIIIDGDETQQYNYWSGALNNKSDDYHFAIVINDHASIPGPIETGYAALKMLVETYKYNTSFISMTNYYMMLRSFYNLETTWNTNNDQVTIKNLGDKNTVPVGIRFKDSITSIKMDDVDYYNFREKSLIVPALEPNQQKVFQMVFGSSIGKHIDFNSHNVFITNISNESIKIADAVNNPYSQLTGNIKIFGENYIYGDEANVIDQNYNTISFSFKDEKTLYKKQMSAVPSSSSVNITLTTFDISKKDVYGETVVGFIANSIDGNNVNFTVGGLSPNKTYQIKKGGVFLSDAKANASGVISFNNSDWSEHTFTISNNHMSDMINPYISFILLIVMIVAVIGMVGKFGTGK